jgi:probable HAF family extracellular repeat protein
VVRWDGQVATQLGGLPGDTYAGGFDINDAGQVCGSSFSPVGTFHPVVFTPGQGTQPLSGIPAGQTRGINSVGQVTGYIGDDHIGGPYEAFRWTAPGTVQPLGVLPTFDWSFGEDINDAGDVVGWCRRGAEPDAAFLWTDAGGMTNLGSLGPGDTDAFAINSARWVVGASNGRVFLWRPGVGMIDLNSLLSPSSGWLLQHATDINDLGQIVGFGTLNGASHSWVLTVPGPGGSLMLSAMAAGGLASVARRRSV